VAARQAIAAGKFMIAGNILADESEIPNEHVGTDLLMTLTPQRISHRLKLLLTTSRKHKVVALVASLADHKQATALFDNCFHGVPDLIAHFLD
jgi:hypothetical protein